MTGARKFGTFSGVFTPSILTILGVIMYLRLPSIIGQAGLFTTLAIIVVAHVISVTTGLSVASVATDRKVRGGGTYYMLSRSLGLPIGGTLGIALFVGLSFAVSLYIIGFAESFLGFWGIEATLNAIRVVGVIVLALVTIVTLISTSLALRAQFFILAAIALSLLSILLGVGRHELAPAAAGAVLDVRPVAASFIVLFGIFFPAVTGFEAGVSMSGDLRDPKQSIPAGTIAAILVGLAVYIGLTVFLAYTVDARALATDPLVLQRISLASPLVLAGVWGATVSSALGSVLAAPRILQATSIDRITPAFFGRGYGRENEPRHALLLTVLIALGGILIGELDVIARIVSMFFITAYGFLNLACAIESWASPDFRPTFRVPRAVPVLGALACLVVMIQLDLVAMIGASLVLGALYFYLTRKQLRLDAGDAWSGFWASVARAAVHRLDRSGAHRRNWRPNVLAFSLPDTRRSPFFSLGRELSGQRGMLTAIDVGPGAAERAAQESGLAEADAGYGVFTQPLECADPYARIADVARFHGFAGLVPNTVLVPWPDQPGADFEALLAQLAGVDRNLLVLATSAAARAQPPRIDVWWWDDPATAVLQLSLLRSLSASESWRSARVRVITAAQPGGARGLGVERRMAALLDEMRVDAEIHVARDRAGPASIGDIVTEESAGADLVLLDATPLTIRPRVLDCAAAAAVRAGLRSVVFSLPAGSFGAGIAASAPRAPARRALPALDAPAREPRLPSGLRLPADPSLAAAVSDAHGVLRRIADRCAGGPLQEAYGRTMALIERTHGVLDGSLAAAAGAADQGRARSERAVRKAYGDLLYRTGHLLAEHRTGEVTEQSAALTDFANCLSDGLAGVAEEVSPVVGVELDRAAFARAPGDDLRLRAFKLMKRVVSMRRTRVRLSVPLEDLTRRHCTAALPVVERAVRDCAEDAVAAVAGVQGLLASALAALERARAAAERGDDVADVLRPEREQLREHAESLLQRHQAAAGAVPGNAARAVRQVAHRIAHDIGQVDVARRARVDGALLREAESSAARARELPGAWQAAQALLLQGVALELSLLALRNRVATIVDRARARLGLHAEALITRLRAVRTAVDEFARASAADPDAEFTRLFEQWPEFATELVIEELRTDLRVPSGELPERVETLSPAAATRLANGDFEDLETVALALRPLVDYHLDAEFLGPVQDRLQEVPDVYARAAATAQHAVRLTAFRFRDTEGEGNEDGGRAQLLADALRRLDGDLLELRGLVAELDEFITDRLDQSLAALEPHRLLRDTGRLPQYIRAQRGREALGWFQVQRRRARRFAGEQAVRVLYQRSEAIRFARELEAGDRATGALLDLVAAVSPDPDVLQRLPYHYRQLFLGKPRFSRDFWAGWSVERRLAARAVAHYRRGFQGPLLVLGEPFSGRSALVQAIADEHFSGVPTYRVVPPLERTTLPDALFARIAETVGAASGAEDPLGTVPAGAVLIFDDIDRWWERTPDGYAALEAALELMERHTGRCVFLVSADVHAFRFIDRARDIGRRFLATIECRPFSAREIGDVVQLRHGSTGLHFELEGVDEQRLSGIARARLFHRLFDYSSGNIGAALHAWIAHIRAVEGDRVRIARPTLPNLFALDALEPLHRLLLVQLVLHRSLDADRLLRLGGARPELVAAPLAELRRSRVIIPERETGGETQLVINPFLRPFVARRLSELEMIE